MCVMRKKAMGMQNTGDTISITIPESMFLNENGLNVSLDYEDLIDWCFQREVGESQMNIFMNMHWTLAVISPWNGLVYWLDPLGAENKINSFPEKIITEGIKQFSSVHWKDIKKIKKNAYIRWEQPQCPRQPAYTKYCGYFVCRYMLEIVQKRVLWVSKQVFHSICTYSSEDIDEMRDLWIKYVLDHEPDEEDS
ncbi:uncharacterized protein LOC110739375 [Chenopodium quinoa]|uniref:uncharacterized protein LOC110739375 n=1 Tax=Chenopodium quinoa TaxID=63459 RepID=UPI000B79429A|nr:uncharacterized protein LOC110739375 [Chenopodium quinoa]XP_021775523.1 uncharacterized protein LOC110739375 [Chenopodium quinoa]